LKDQIQNGLPHQRADPESKPVLSSFVPLVQQQITSVTECSNICKIVNMNCLISP